MRRTCRAGEHHGEFVEGSPRDHAAGLDANRGLRLVGNKLKTRDRTQGREWNPIGRLLHQTAAVELVERAISICLGSKSFVLKVSTAVFKLPKRMP